MDKTEAYIKMCDCWDIQIYRIPTIKSIGDEKECQWQNGDFFVQNVLIDRPSGIYIYKDLCPYCKPSPGIKMLWLPRQDQIQEMIDWKLIGENGILQWFGVLGHWLGREMSRLEKTEDIAFNDRYDTYEKFWLAFYMHEKHGKTWDGKEWIKK